MGAECIPQAYSLAIFSTTPTYEYAEKLCFPLEFWVFSLSFWVFSLSSEGLILEFQFFPEFLQKL